MILSGDEFKRTQIGNNNTYCQDNELGWIDWNNLERNQSLFRFFKLLIQFRKKHDNLRRSQFNVELVDGDPEMSWHGFRLNHPDWSENARSLALQYRANKRVDSHLFIIFNSDLSKHQFELPRLNNKQKWYRVMDTSLLGPNDILDEGKFTSTSSIQGLGALKCYLLRIHP